jgi:tetratricopeptide (TPR) repeat protein
MATTAGREAKFLIGICLSEMGDDAGAIKHLAEVSRLSPGTPESLPAEFRMAQLLRRLGRDEDAIEMYCCVLEGIGDPRAFSNPWIKLDDVRRGSLEAYEHYFDSSQFETGLALAESLAPLFSRSRVVELKADTRRAWGRHLLKLAEQVPRSESRAAEKDGRRQLRQAGALYSVLARLRIATRAYPEDLWASAECFFEGQNYGAAESALREYLASQAQRRRPQVLVCLGQANLAQGRIDEALEQLHKCIEYHPRDPASFRARLVASAAHREKSQLQQAEALLLENLEGDFLTPASAEWRDSLFALGRLLHTEARFEEAIRRLDEAVVRYPDDPQAVDARYLLGDCCRRNAQLAAAKMDTEIVASVRDSLAGNVADLYRSALAHFEQAREMLGTREEQKGLTECESATLRACYFTIAHVQFDLGRYDAAIKAYSAAAIRYQDAPEVLEAYVQTARAYQRLDRTDEARSALEQAKLALARMQPITDFTATTNYSREEWSQLLNRLSQSIGKTARI